MAIAVAFTRNPIRTKTINGITYELDLREVIDSSLYFTSTYEVKIDQLFEKYVKPGSTVIDIGANIGLHTLRSALLTGDKGKVIAIEPSTWAINKLRRNLELNPFLSSSVTILKVALGAQPQKSSTIGFQSSYRLSGRNQVSPEVVDVLTLDQAIQQSELYLIDVIKIDVDGHEVGILFGSISSLSKFLPTLIVEFTPSFSTKYLSEFSQLWILMTQMGYEAYTDEGASIPNLEERLARLPPGDSVMVLFINPKR
jgi:FkbM family methyltransferase